VQKLPFSFCPAQNITSCNQSSRIAQRTGAVARLRSSVLDFNNFHASLPNAAKATQPHARARVREKGMQNKKHDDSNARTNLKKKKKTHRERTTRNALETAHLRSFSIAARPLSNFPCARRMSLLSRLCDDERATSFYMYIIVIINGVFLDDLRIFVKKKTKRYEISTMKRVHATRNPHDKKK